MFIQTVWSSEFTAEDSIKVGGVQFAAVHVKELASKQVPIAPTGVTVISTESPATIGLGPVDVAVYVRIFPISPILIIGPELIV